MKNIKFFFDFLSPYSYFCWQKLKDNHFKRDDLNFEFLPVSMGSIFKKLDFKGPGEIEPKRNYMLKKCFEFAAKEYISFNPPQEHPFNPLYSLRLATKNCSTTFQHQVIDILWRAAWEKGLNIGDPDVIAEQLKLSGLPAESLIESSFTREAKAEVKSNIQMAIDLNLFGVPSLIYEDELFWGVDSLPDLNSRIDGYEVNWNKDLFEKLTK